MHRLRRWQERDYQELVAKNRESIEQDKTVSPLIGTLGALVAIGSALALAAEGMRAPKPPARVASDIPTDRDWWTERGRS
jgi:hypothetical protein